MDKEGQSVVLQTLDGEIYGEGKAQHQLLGNLALRRRNTRELRQCRPLMSPSGSPVSDRPTFVQKHLERPGTLSAFLVFLRL